MTLIFAKFKGAIPKMAAHLLPVDKAQVADGCDTTMCDLRSLPMPDKISLLTVNDIRTLHQWYDGSILHWLENEKDIDYVRNPISNDTYSRLFFTGENEMRFFANDNKSDPFDPTTDYLKCGIPAPGTAPTVGSTGGSEYRAYIYAFLNRYGDIGSNSPVGSTSTHLAGNRVTLTNIDSAPADRAIDRVWIYRTNSGSAGYADFQFVCEAKYFDSSESYAVGDYVIYSNQLYECTTAHSGAWNASHFTAGEAVSDDDLGEKFQAENYLMPPDGLTGLVGLPNGVFAGFVGNTLYLSEPYKPHAWPNSESFKEQIVGLAVLGSSLVVLTDSYPKLLYGQDPSNMSKVDYPLLAPCRQKRTIAVGEGRVFYSTDEGLVALSESSGNVVTASVLNYEDWQEILPNHGQFYQGKYFGWHTSGGFIVDFRENDFVTVNLVAHAGYVSTYDSKYYLAQDEYATTPPSGLGDFWEDESGGDFWEGDSDFWEDDS